MKNMIFTMLLLVLHAGAYAESSVTLADKVQNVINQESAFSVTGVAPAAFATVGGGMKEWKSGVKVLSDTNVWYNVPQLNTSFNVTTASLWRVHANVRYRFHPIGNGDNCTVRLRILVDGVPRNIVGAVLNLADLNGLEEVNQHLDIEALVQLAAGAHTVSVQVLKWQAAPNSVIDVAADANGYATLLYHKIANL